jgi:DNA polymerase-3 subunit delta'
MRYEIFLSKHTRKLLDAALESGSHAIELVSPNISGYEHILEYIFINTGALEASVISIAPVNRSIGIDDIRSLRLKFALKSFSGTKQLIIINDANLMTREAQNALLKILEEPPKDTVFIVVTNDDASLLPTIHSRCTIINISKPDTALLIKYFVELGYKESEVSSAMALSDGWPELAEAILKDDSTEFTEIIKYSKELLQKPLNEKLMEIEKLSKDKNRIKLVLFALERLAKSAFDKKIQSTGVADPRWLNIMELIEKSQMLYKNNVTSRLLLTNLMVNL